MTQQDTVRDIRDQIEDAEDAVMGLRPEDALTHLANVEALLDELETPSPNDRN